MSLQHTSVITCARRGLPGALALLGVALLAGGGAWDGAGAQAAESTYRVRGQVLLGTGAAAGESSPDARRTEAAQPAEAQPDSPPPGTPLPGATVRLLKILPELPGPEGDGGGPAGEARVETGPDGRFELAVDLAPYAGRPGTLRLLLQVSAPGLARRMLAVPQTGGQARPGGLAELGGITLPRGTDVTGRVVVAGSGDPPPLAGVRVSLWPQEVEGAEPWLASTGEDGTFSLGDVPPGAYTLLLDRPGYLPHSERDQVIPAPPATGARAQAEGDGPAREGEAPAQKASGGEMPAAGAPGDATPAGAAPAGVAPIGAPPADAVSAKGEPPALDLGTLTLERGRRLGGQVVDSTGEPLAGVEVEHGFFPPRPIPHDWLAPASTTTGTDGRFTLDGVSAGDRLGLSFSKPGFRRRYETLTPERGEGVLHLPAPVVLEQAGTLAGRVEGPDGEPVAGARLDPHLEGEGYRGIVVVHLSEADGSFHIPGLEAGRYGLGVAAPGFLAQTVAVEARPGEVTTVRITLTPVDTLDVRLAVQDADGQPVAGAEVFFSSLDGGPAHYHRALLTDGAGAGLLDHVPLGGPYSLEVRHPDHPRWSREDVEIGAGDAILEVELPPVPWRLLPVAGWVVDEAGEAVPGAAVSLSPLDGGRPAHSVGSATEGRFRFPRVKEGAYRLMAEAPGFAAGFRLVKVTPALGELEMVLDPGAVLTGPLRGLTAEELEDLQIRAGVPGVGLDLRGVVEGTSYRIESLGAGTWTVTAWAGETRIEAAVAIEHGQRRAWLPLEFPRRYRVAGRLLVDGRPLERASLTLSTPPGAPASQQYATTADPRGRFLFPAVVAGRYDLSHLGPIGSVRREIEVSGDLELTLDLTTTEIAGRVVDARSGAGIEGIDVQALGVVVSSHGPEFKGTTDAQGTFEIGPVVSGSWTLYLRPEGYQVHRQPVEVGPGSAPVEIRLEPAGGLHIRAAAATGRPLRHLQLSLRDAQGEVVHRGSAQLTAAGDAVYSGAWEEAPPGRWHLHASDNYTWTHADVEIPGPEVVLSLPAAGSLSIRVLDLELEAGSRLFGERPLEVEATLDAPDDPGYDGPAVHRRRGFLSLTSLAPGRWQVVVRADDGREWSGTATIRDGQRSELILP